MICPRMSWGDGDEDVGLGDFFVAKMMEDDGTRDDFEVSSRINRSISHEILECKSSFFGEDLNP